MTTRREVLQELRLTGPAPGPDGTYSSKDLRTLTGWGEERVLSALAALIEAGRWEVVQVRRRAFDGRIATVRAYRPKKRRKR